MICDSLFYDTNLISVFTFESYDISPRHCHNPAPLWHNARNTANDSLHLTGIDELTMDAALQLLNDLAEVKDSRVLVHEEEAKGFGYT